MRSKLVTVTFLLFGVVWGAAQTSMTPYWGFFTRPIKPIDVYRLELCGLRLRALSRWLNAASFQVPAGKTAVLASYPAVKEVQKVKRAKLKADRPTAANLMKINYSDDDYGLSLEQLAPMNVPEVHRKGIFGTGARIAIFDTGFDSLHPSVRHLWESGNIVAVHDFNSGDRIWTTECESLPPFPTDDVYYVNSYDVAREDSSVLIVFSAAPDWAISGYNAVENNWSIYCVHAIEHNGIIDWSDTSSVISFGLVSGDTFLIQPDAVVRNDTLFIVWQKSVILGDFEIYFAKAKIDTSPVVDTVRLSADTSPSLDPALIVKEDTVIVFWLNPEEGLTMSYSTDGGSSFSWPTVVHAVAGEPGGLIVSEEEPYVVVFSLGDSLFVGRSESGLLNWEFQYLAQGTEPDIDISDDTVRLVYTFDTGSCVELHYAVSTDGGATWLSPTVLDTIFYPSSPAIGKTNEGVFVVYSADGVLVRKFVDSGTIDTLCGIYSDCPVVCGGRVFWRRRGDDDVYPDHFTRHQVFYNPVYHGTKMLSVIAGFSPRELIGVAPDAEFVLAKTEKIYSSMGMPLENQIEEDFWVEALEWATKEGAKVVSSSLGYPNWYTVDQLDGQTAITSKAASMALSRGVLVVTAMGNYLRSDSVFPDPSVGDTTLYPPADAMNIISAGAYVVDEEGELIPKGSYGPTYDGRIKPELIAPYYAYCAVDTIFVGDYGDSSNVYFWQWGGTSFSTALIAGVAALVLSAHPNWSASKLRRVLLETARPVEIPGWPNAPVPNNVIGFGLPDALKAVEYEEIEVPTVEEDVALFTPYPNPINLKETTVLRFPYCMSYVGPGTLRIYTVSGKLVLKKEFDNIHVGRGELMLDLSREKDKLAPGLYLAVLTTSFGSAKTKFAVVK